MQNSISTVYDCQNVSKHYRFPPVHKEEMTTQVDDFDILKAKLCEEPLLQRPDFSQPFILKVDASGFAIGSILSQWKLVRISQ